MTAAFDNTFLTLLLNPHAEVRPHPDSGKITEFVEEKIESLLDDLSGRHERLIVLALAIAEVMCIVRPAARVVERLNSFSCIEPHPFDQKCAVTLSDLVHHQGNRVWL